MVSGRNVWLNLVDILPILVELLQDSELHQRDVVKVELLFRVVTPRVVMVPRVLKLHHSSEVFARDKDADARRLGPSTVDFFVEAAGGGDDVRFRNERPLATVGQLLAHS